MTTSPTCSTQTVTLQTIHYLPLHIPEPLSMTSAAISSSSAMIYGVFVASQMNCETVTIVRCAVIDCQPDWITRCFEGKIIVPTKPLRINYVHCSTFQFDFQRFKYLVGILRVEPTKSVHAGRLAPTQRFSLLSTPPRQLPLIYLCRSYLRMYQVHIYK